MAECCLFAIGGMRPSCESGERRAPAPPQGWRDSFAARLDVSIEGRACWFAFDELDVACLRNRRCATIARGRGASRPCIPSRGSEILSLRGWTFLLRVAHSVPMERLGRAGRCLFAGSEVRDRCSRAGSVAPLHPHEGRRGSFAARLGVSIEGRMLFICRVGGVGHCAKAGSVAPLQPLKGWRGSFAARLGVSIEGRACWFAYDELDVACLQIGGV